MNLFNIIDELEKIDPELNDRFNPRRAAIKNITSFGSKVAMAAMPFALGTMFKRAYGSAAAAPSVIDVLNYALTLEYLEAKFYATAVAKSGFIPANFKPTYTTISNDENEHVIFLTNVIKSLNGTPAAVPNFDFSAGGGPGNKGPLGDNVFTDFTTFQKVAIAFEDTGVRAYKGQAPNLLGNQVVLTAALSIHAVEARHASAVRRALGVTPWITSTATKGNDTGVDLVDGNYDGEQNLKQGTINDITVLPSLNASTTSVAVATAAFDEPLSMDQVLALLVGTFIY